jgi:hypothetical protein
MADRDPLRRAGNPAPGASELWAVEWSDGRLSVLDAYGIAEVRHRAETRVGQVSDGWPEAGSVKPESFWPAAFLELSVASRRELNVPKAGRVVIAGNEVGWSGPCREEQVRRGGSTPGLPDPEPGWKRVRFPCGLWAYVWNELELVLCSAPDFKSVKSWAKRSGLGQAEAGDIEPVERMELQLLPDKGGYAPSCYRVWIEGYKVGWPPTESQSPRPREGPPSGPFHAEARLPIPAYARTYAYAPGYSRTGRRLLDIPWREDG